MCRVVCVSHNATGKAGTEAGMAEGAEEGEGDPQREVVEIKRWPPRARAREIKEIMKLSDKPRSQQQQAVARISGIEYTKVDPLTSKYVSLSPQHPAKRAQFKVALLGGGARPRERAPGDRPGGGRGTLSPRRVRARNEIRGPETGGQRIPI